MTIISDTEIRPFRTDTRESGSKHSIVAEGLRKEFPGGVIAVAGVDLDIHEGEIFGFLGPNGASEIVAKPLLTSLAFFRAGV